MFSNAYIAFLDRKLCKSLALRFCFQNRKLNSLASRLERYTIFLSTCQARNIIAHIRRVCADTVNFIALSLL